MKPLDPETCQTLQLWEWLRYYAGEAKPFLTPEMILAGRHVGLDESYGDDDLYTAYRSAAWLIAIGTLTSAASIKIVETPSGFEPGKGPPFDRRVHWPATFAASPKSVVGTMRTVQNSLAAITLFATEWQEQVAEWEREAGGEFPSLLKAWHHLTSALNQLRDASERLNGTYQTRKGTTQRFAHPSIWWHVYMEIQHVRCILPLLHNAIPSAEGLPDRGLAAKPRWRARAEALIARIEGVLGPSIDTVDKWSGKTVVAGRVFYSEGFHHYAQELHGRSTELQRELGVLWTRMTGTSGGTSESHDGFYPASWFSAAIRKSGGQTSREATVILAQLARSSPGASWHRQVRPGSPREYRLKAVCAIPRLKKFAQLWKVAATGPWPKLRIRTATKRRAKSSVSRGKRK